MDERIVRLAADTLEAAEVSLWLQLEPDGEVGAAAVAGEAVDGDRRRQLLGARFSSLIAKPFSERSEPFVLHPEDYRDIPGAAELVYGGDVAVAPFVLERERMAFLAAGARDGETFGELQLKMLAGLADQANLALCRSR